MSLGGDFRAVGIRLSCVTAVPAECCYQEEAVFFLWLHATLSRLWGGVSFWSRNRLTRTSKDGLRILVRILVLAGMGLAVGLAVTDGWRFFLL